MQEKRLRVLFVEDDSVDRMAFERFVRDEGLPYDCTMADSVAAAKAAFSVARFDVVIADYMLGDGTAFDVLAAARGAPVVFVTGSGNEEVAVRALKGGAADYLTKDPERGYLKVLPATVESAVRRVRVVEQVLKLTEAVEQGPAAVMVLDEFGRVEYANARFEELTGFRRQEVLGSEPPFFASTEHPLRLYDGIRKAMRDARRWTGEVRDRRRDGTRFWARLSLSPVETGDGMVTHFVLLEEDITGRREAEAALRDREARLRLLVEQMPAVLWTTDCELRFTSAQGAALGRLWDSPARLVGSLLPERFGQDGEQHAAVAAHRLALAGKRATYVLDLGEQAYDCVVEPLHDGEGRITGTIGVAEDITELRQAQRDQAALIEELDAFAHTVAHDLKNPLAAVIGFCRLYERAERAPDAAELSSCLHQAALNAGRMQNIIDELLLLSTVRKTDVVPEPVAMRRVVEGAWARLEYMVEASGAELALPAEWASGLGHAPWVEEVWENYLSNAIRYGGRPPRLSLGSDEQGGKARFWVSDNGAGIPPGEHHRLFLPFSRLHQVRAAGHGLGLSIVRRIVEKLGGDVWFSSAPGRGSTFGFSLPAANVPLMLSGVDSRDMQVL
jgi:PAS domain S-box-containing protein